MDEDAAEKLAELHEKQSQRSEEGTNRKNWTVQGISTEASSIGPRDDILSSDFTANKP